MYTCDVTDKLFCFVIRFLRLGVSCFKYRGSIWWCKISFRIWNVRNVRFSSWRFEPVFRLSLWYVFEMLFQFNHGLKHSKKNRMGNIFKYPIYENFSTEIHLIYDLHDFPEIANLELDWKTSRIILRVNFWIFKIHR